MIKSFANQTTEKVFNGEALTRKEIKKLGSINIEKAQRRLTILNSSDERGLLIEKILFYHKLEGTNRYSIDADNRRSPWRITFQWENDEMKDVKLVKIEDTH